MCLSSGEHQPVVQVSLKVKFFSIQSELIHVLMVHCFCTITEQVARSQETHLGFRGDVSRYVPLPQKWLRCLNGPIWSEISGQASLLEPLIFPCPGKCQCVALWPCFTFHRCGNNLPWSSAVSRKEKHGFSDGGFKMDVPLDHPCVSLQNEWCLGCWPLRGV